MNEPGKIVPPGSVPPWSLLRCARWVVVGIVAFAGGFVVTTFVDQFLPHPPTAISALPPEPPPSPERAKLLEYQRQCEDFSPGANILLFDLEQNVAAGSPPSPMQFVDAPLEPACLANYEHALGIGEFFGPVFFLHQRTGRHGTVRLVAMAFEGYFSAQNVLNPISAANPFLPPNVLAETFTEADSRSNPVSLYPLRTHRHTGADLRGVVSLFAGQPDSKDASHFTVLFRGDDTLWHVMDGWLQDDGTVKITYRPATPAELPSGIK